MWEETVMKDKYHKISVNVEFNKQTELPSKIETASESRWEG